MNRWFRAYDEAVDDPKLQRLPGETFKTLFNLWCLASQNGGTLPPLDDIVFKLRMPPKRVNILLSQLIKAELLDEDETGLHPHNWNGRQFKSDGSTERVKRFRERQGNVSSPVTGTGGETGPDTEQSRTESEEEKETLSGFQKDGEVLPPKPAARHPPVSRPTSSTTRGTRLPDDFEPDETCHAVVEELLLTRQQSQQAFDNFRDYWRAKPGANGCKLDWQATFRIWLRKEKFNGQGPSRGPRTIEDKWDEFDIALAGPRRRENPGHEASSAPDAGGLPGLREGLDELPVGDNRVDFQPDPTRARRVG